MADPTRWLILMRSLIDGEWEVVPDRPGSNRATPFKVLANGRHQLSVLQERDPGHAYALVPIPDPDHATIDLPFAYRIFDK